MPTKSVNNATAKIAKMANFSNGSSSEKSTKFNAYVLIGSIKNHSEKQIIAIPWIYKKCILKTADSVSLTQYRNIIKTKQKRDQLFPPYMILI